MDDISKKATLFSFRKNMDVHHAFWYILVALNVKNLYFAVATGLNSAPFSFCAACSEIASASALACLLTAAVRLVFTRAAMVVIGIAYLALSCLLIADTNFFRYYNNIITIQALAQFDFRLTSSIDESIMNLFALSDIVYILDFPLVIVALFYHFRFRRNDYSTTRHRLSHTAIMLLAGLTLFMVSYQMFRSHKPSMNVNFKTRMLGPCYAHIDNIVRYMHTKNPSHVVINNYRLRQIDNFFRVRAVSDMQVEYRAAASGKNLIFIQVEGLQEFVIGKEICGRPITPHLNRLRQRGLYFSNIYSQVFGGSTSDAELLYTASLYPVPEGAVSCRYAGNTYQSLPRLLKSHGYTARALHAFGKHFWNRAAMFRALGFDAFIDDSSFVLDESLGWKGTALSDASFFRQALGFMNADTLHYSYLITLTTHYAFGTFRNSGFPVGEYEKTFLGDYFKAAHYADSCIGIALEQIRVHGQEEKSIIVICGDHPIVPRFRAGELMKFLGCDNTDVNFVKQQKVPVFIAYPGCQSRIVETVGGQIDVMPTVAQLLGVSVPYAVGKDILNTRKGYAVFPDGSYISHTCYYRASHDCVYNLSGMVLPKTLHQEEISKGQRELALSQAIFELDYFSHK